MWNRNQIMRVLAALLVVVMLASVPMSAYATENVEEIIVDNVQQEVEQDTISEAEPFLSEYAVGASGDGDDYPAHLRNQDYWYCYNNAVADDWRFVVKQCTSFVAHCLNSRNGVAFTNDYLGRRWSHAQNWGRVAKECGITVDMNPKKGSVYWLDRGTWGHVAWVSEVKGNKVVIQEYNWPEASGYGCRPVDINSASGYIHIKDIPETIVGSDMPDGGPQTIPDGDYHIVTGVDQSMCLDIYCSSSDNGANAQIWHSTEIESQVFTVTYLGRDRGYKIIHKKSGKSLSVEGASREIGANVCQWEYYDPIEHTQQWVIHEVDNAAYYTIQSRGSGFYLDVYGGGTADETNVQMWSWNGSAAQKWRFIPASGQTIADGDYCITTGMDRSMCLDVKENNAEIRHNAGNESQTFQVVYLNNGFYKIIHKATGKSLDVMDAGAVRGTNVQTVPYTGSYAQQWAIRKTGDGAYYTIQSRCSGHYLDVANGNTADGTNVWMTVGNGSMAQQWKFTSPSASEGTQTILDGDYRIVVETGDGCLDIANASYQNGANVQIGHDAKQKEQIFTVTYLNNGFYKIINKYTGKSLDVDTGGSSSRANVRQWEYDGSNRQQWKISIQMDSYCTIQSRENSFYLNVTNENKGALTNVCVQNDKNGASYIWRFIPVGERTLEDGPYQVVIGYSNLGVSSERYGEGVRRITDFYYFDFVYVGEGYYKLACKNTGFYLDAGKTTANCNGKYSGSEVQIWKEEDVDSQLWFVRDNGDGSYSLISKYNGMYISSYGGYTMMDLGESIKQLEIKPVEVKLNPPSADLASGAEVEVGTEVRLTCDTEGGTIYYTLNGTNPTLQSNRYDGPIRIEKDTILIAYTVKRGYADSDAVSFSYSVVQNASVPDVNATETTNQNVVIEIPTDGYVYDGTKKRPNVIIKDEEGNRLRKGKDYTLSYKNNKNAGTAKIIIKGKGKKYKGKKAEYFFTIHPCDIASGTKRKEIRTVEYQGKQIRPKVSIKNNKGKKLRLKRDYSVTYENNQKVSDLTDAKAAFVIIKGIGNYSGTCRQSFVIRQRTLGKGFRVKGLKAQVYSGQAIEPEIQLYDRKNLLTEGIDYKISYRNNVEKGTAEVVITAVEESNYKGSMTKQFQIR